METHPDPLNQDLRANLSHSHSEHDCYLVIKRLQETKRALLLYLRSLDHCFTHADSICATRELGRELAEQTATLELVTARRDALVNDQLRLLHQTRRLPFRTPPRSGVLISRRNTLAQRRRVQLPPRLEIQKALPPNQAPSELNVIGKDKETSCIRGRGHCS